MTGRWIIFGLVCCLVLAGLSLLVAAGIALCKRQWTKAGIRFGIAVAPFVLAAAILPVLAAARPHHSRASRCMSNLSQLGKAMKMYSMDHAEEFPTSFLSLTNYVSSNPKLFVCPHSGTKVGPIETVDQWADYILVTNLTERSFSALVHAYCKPGNHRDNKGINVLYIDGSVTWVQVSDYGTLTCDVLKGSRVNDMEPQPEAGGYRR
jgi:prepilin-type processing-associated H-X9-DG protein